MDDEDVRISRETDCTPRELDDMSVEALRNYADQLHSELERVRSAIGAKEDYLSKADTLFRS